MFPTLKWWALENIDVDAVEPDSIGEGPVSVPALRWGSRTDTSGSFPIDEDAARPSWSGEDEDAKGSRL